MSSPTGYHGEGIDVEQTLSALNKAAARSGFRVETLIEASGYPVWVMTRPARHSPDARPPPNGYLSSGVHGDEPAGPLAVLRLLEEDVLPATMHWTIFPMLCPGNLAALRRSHPNGQDPNRDYHAPTLPEVSAQVAWMKENLTRLDTAWLLHEDWESPGFYIYEVLAKDSRSLAPPMLEAAKARCGLNTAPVIEGLPAHEGLIAFRGINPPLDAWPEALWLAHHGANRVYTTETPGSAALASRVDAHCLTLRASLEAM